VHIYDVAGGLQQVQEIDLFGEIAGISFSPDGQGFFVGVSDVAYNSLVQYQLRPQGGLDPWGCEPWTQDPLHQPQQPQQQQQQQATAAAGERRWQQRRGDAAAAAEQEEDPHEME
jgi:secreted PhoX family phosphatase